MSIYHLSVKTISRSDGRSSTAAAAYRAGVEIVDQRTGVVHDYTRRGGVEFYELVLPERAPRWDRSQLWNAAELSETRKNSTVGREYELALPAELTPNDRKNLVRDFADELVARHGVAVDFAIHSPSRDGDERNYHAHVLTSTRRLGPDGFGEKSRELDAKATGFKEVTHWRERWAVLVNSALERAGEAARVDHRSLRVQHAEAVAVGDVSATLELDRAPTRHLGPIPTMDLRESEAKQREPRTERARDHLEIIGRNKKRRGWLEMIAALLVKRATSLRDMLMTDWVAKRDAAALTAARTKAAPLLARLKSNMANKAESLDMSTPAPTREDYELVAGIPARRAADPSAQPTLTDMAALNRIIVQQERDRLVEVKEAPPSAAKPTLLERLKSKMANTPPTQIDIDSAIAKGRLHQSKIDNVVFQSKDLERAAAPLTPEKMDMSTPAPSKADFELVARITERRATHPNAQPSLAELAAINRVLVQQARERVAAEIEAEADNNRSMRPGW